MKRNLARTILILSVIAWAVMLISCITIPAESAQIELPDREAEDDGRIPGDDIPATNRCYLTEEEVQEDHENYYIEQALLAKAHKIENCTVTHYDCCALCCGKTDGITASGLQATPGVTVGVDPDVIPLGSDVLVDHGDDEIHYYRADDTGNFRGNHIDLCVESHKEAIQLGVRTATVYCVEETK